MKLWSLLLCLLLCLCGCALPSQKYPSDTSAAIPAESMAETVAPLPESETEAKVETEKPPVFPYTVKITRPDLTIHEAAGYDYYAAMLLPIGTYTITEEAKDEEGNLWGKLKSGAGWIDLTKAAETPASPILLTAEQLPKNTLPDGPYHEHIASADDYALRMLFRAYGVLTNITFSALSYGDSGTVPVGDVYTLAKLTPEKPLVITASFPGDLSAYGISYTDADGNRHNCMLSISGRNGSLVMQEYTPAP